MSEKFKFSKACLVCAFIDGVFFCGFLCHVAGLWQPLQVGFLVERLVTIVRISGYRQSRIRSWRFRFHQVVVDLLVPLRKAVEDHFHVRRRVRSRGCASGQGGLDFPNCDPRRLFDRVAVDAGGDAGKGDSIDIERIS